VAIGYKCNRKKCLFFVCTPGAGKTTAGAPYKATFPDTYGNVQSRDVARPAVISRHFMHSDGIDIHNHIRQHILALESSWRTEESWFSLMTTMLGITVTGAFLAYRAELRDSHEDKYLSMLDFADALAMQLLELGDEPFSSPKRRRFEDLDGSQLGAVRPIADSAAEAQADPTSEHVMTSLERTEKVNAQGTTYYQYMQRKCTVCGCYNAAHYCIKCGFAHGPVCKSASKTCFATHVRRAFEAAEAAAPVAPSSSRPLVRRRLSAPASSSSSSSSSSSVFM
jgi:hypothetical protein